MATILTYVNAFLAGDLNSAATHIVLLGGSIAAEVAVAIGIVLEAPKEKTCSERLGMVLVLGGVSVSAIFTIALFVFDEGTSGAQQSKIIALETRLAPRDLSPDQQQLIAGFIRPFAGTLFDMSMHVDIEPMRLLGQIESAMNAGDWHEGTSSDGGQKFNRGEGTMPVGERTILAVWVLHPIDDPKLAKAAGMLIWALRNEGIITQEVLESKPQPPDIGVVHVWVGAKP